MLYLFIFVRLGAKRPSSYLIFDMFIFMYDITYYTDKFNVLIH